jgi:hypothetical protein
MAQTIAPPPTRGPVTGTADRPKKHKPFLIDLYSTAVGKKYAMAISGVAMMGFVVAHMVGNLKMYLGAADLDHYAEYPEPEDYDIAGVIKNLWELHDVVDQAFRKATTENAKLDWK